MVEEETTKIGVVVLAPLLVPWTVRIAVGEEELIPTLRFGLTTNIDEALLLATLKISLVPPVPWMLKPMVEEVALKPKTLPLNKRLAEEVKLELLLK